jgi:hypothetical protein
MSRKPAVPPVAPQDQCPLPWREMTTTQLGGTYLDANGHVVFNLSIGGPNGRFSQIRQRVNEMLAGQSWLSILAQPDDTLKNEQFMWFGWQPPGPLVRFGKWSEGEACDLTGKVFVPQPTHFIPMFAPDPPR